ncbi:lipopolysaccharide biosynthesis [Trichococcus palustris]|jgi:capsular polysaccharide biosynthesis protein|uniref:Capsular polysaccharide biosynthesis protein CpsC n=1 Tax=Trichococcus palustris TaxID=140314 RepID=A0A143YUD5_9LACT|nr:Wzz/FepE/Etk N-terminal domain-containing protein [Trichococcus palustris]CZQ97012.1 lipopolysaccharide biosynthesis [Trichococcus palustris]SFK75131.1 Capsular polysaccharide biosynthesis protein [Trichococcus palustris]
MKEEVSLKDLMAIIKQRMWIIISFGTLGLLLSAVYTFLIVTPMYDSTTQLLVNRTNDGTNSIQLNDINSNVQMINTYKDIIKGPVILEGVKEKLNLDYTVEQLAEMIVIGVNQNSQVFSLTVTAPNAGEAAEIANGIAATFQSAIFDIMNVENVSIISGATVNSKPVSPVAVNNLVIGLGVGLLFGFGIALLRYALDKTIDDHQFVAQTIGWPNLGVISELNKEELLAISNMPKKERVPVPQIRKSDSTGNLETAKRERIGDLEMRTSEDIAIKETSKEKPVDIAEKRKKKTDSMPGGIHREKLTTVSEMTREKIGAILKNESSQSANAGSERGK